MKRIFLIAIVAALAVTARAEMQRQNVTLSGSTNTSLNCRGLLYRLVVNVSGTTSTNDLLLVDGDGSVIVSNTFTSGTATTSYSTPVPFVGLTVTSLNGNGPTITNAVAITLDR